MKTFHIEIKIGGKVTVPDTVLRDLRMAAADDPYTEGGDKFLNMIHKQHYEDDDAFLRAALSNALRNIARNGIIEDIGGMGVGVKCAPAQVTVSVPERVVTRIQSKEQIGVERIDVQRVPTPDGALPNIEQ